MIRILFFLETLAEGGAEMVLRTLVNNMDQSRFQITVQTVEHLDPEAYLVPGIRYKTINRCATSWGRKLFSLWLRLCAELKWLYPLYIRDDYHIEVAYLECGPTKMLAGSTNSKALKLAWVHCDLEKKEGMALQAARLRTYYQKYDRVVCVSENVERSFRRLIGNSPETSVLRNVIDEAQILDQAAAFHPERTEVPVFITVGRLTYQKGVDRLLEACARLKEEGAAFHLWLVGEGPDRQKLEKMTGELGLTDRVMFRGFQSNPYPYIRVADFLVVPSRYEGLSTVVTEALILGKPVVATPCSGMTELLGDSEYGLITKDCVDGICNGIRRMLEEPMLRAKYAEAAAQRGKCFSKDTIVSETEHFFLDTWKKKQTN